MRAETSGNSDIKSDTPQVEITLTDDDEDVVLRVIDNGIGFDHSDAAGGMGITNMRSRIKRLGGLMTIESAKGREPETRCVCRSNNLTVGAYGLGQAIHPIANGGLCNATEHDPVCDAADHTNGGSNAPTGPCA